MEMFLVAVAIASCPHKFSSIDHALHNLQKVCMLGARSMFFSLCK